MILWALTNQQNLGFRYIVLYLKWLNFLFFFYNINCFVTSNGEETNIVFFVLGTVVGILQLWVLVCVVANPSDPHNSDNILSIPSYLYRKNLFLSHFKYTTLISISMA